MIDIRAIGDTSDNTTKRTQPMISIIIVAYNEERYLSECLASMRSQSWLPHEIIVVDDGSTDLTASLAQGKADVVVSQEHLGAAIGRNLGSQLAQGDIFVFADADQIFEPDYVERLIAPLRLGATGSFTQEEFVYNWASPWARCWSYARGFHDNQLKNEEEKPETFRAIWSHIFRRIGGFDPIGYTDDRTIARKLKEYPQAATGAICYHNNPDSLGEIFKEARWYGTNEFLTADMTKRLRNLIRHCPLMSPLRAIPIVVKQKLLHYFIARFVFDLGIWISLISPFSQTRLTK